MKITGLGQCSLDYLTQIDGFPTENAKHEVIETKTEGGGPVATALVALSRLGARTTFIGRVSDDTEGKLIKTGLEREGVSTAGLITKTGGNSQKAFIIVNRKNASRTILWKGPTVDKLSAREVDPRLIQGSDMLLLDGLMKEASLQAAGIAIDLNIPIMLDAGSMRDGMTELIELSDYIIGSERFATDFAGVPSKAINKIKKLNPGAHAITITLGKKGSVTHTFGDTLRMPAYKVKAVDTTGAGDVFHAGYAFGVLRKWDLDKTIKFASAMAAMKCLELGGRSGIPGLKETLQFMKEHE